MVSSQEADSVESAPGSSFASEDFIEDHKYEIVTLAKMALDNYIADYQISLAPQRWTIAKFDEDNTVIAITSITYKGVVGDYIFVGTLNMNEHNDIESATPHYIYVCGIVLGDDGYCDDFFNNMAEIMSMYN